MATISNVMFEKIIDAINSNADEGTAYRIREAIESAGIKPTGYVRRDAIRKFLADHEYSFGAILRKKRVPGLDLVTLADVKETLRDMGYGVMYSYDYASKTYLNYCFVKEYRADSLTNGESLALARDIMVEWANMGHCRRTDLLVKISGSPRVAYRLI